ncbi:MAG: tetratricopeptide repeat protein [Candidatus Cloacimonetes bacterium]|jgi:tetratricopeptide (TPR) repeat protein|nr:tetratricopeptide repeat protein [Candidatus Cloacimonadota bacterium]MDD2506091.1 tetratricopeptide repeat protein [Candidatus Cloacimonadota bacterium]MDD4559674.1 tetratricopeptide repeat protein [Candidatus Cloacimonadota bacterium]
MKRKRGVLLLLLALALLIPGLDLLLRKHSVYNSLGEWLYRQERFDKAAKVFDGLAEEEEGAANLAKSLYKQGEYDGASEAAEQALQKSEDKADLHYDRGNIAYMKEDYKTAVEEYEKALLMNPEDDDARENLELALTKLDENQASPPPEPKEDEDQRNEEEVRNILDALDFLEARERKQQSKQGAPQTDYWW